jgi:hypothetical protein
MPPLSKQSLPANLSLIKSLDGEIEVEEVCNEAWIATPEVPSLEIEKV